MGRIIVAFVVGTGLGWLIASLAPLNTSKDPWIIVNSLSTSAAVIVALYFGLRGQMQEHLHSREMARLMASRAKATLQRQAAAINEVHAILTSQDRAPEPDAVELSQAMKCIGNASPYIDCESLMQLLPLPKRVAHKLARVQGQCEATHADMVTKIDRWDRMSSSERKHAVRVWFLGIIGAKSDIEVALRVCTNASLDMPPTRSLNWDE